MTSRNRPGNTTAGADSTSTILPQAYSVGAYVDVEAQRNYGAFDSDGGAGYITNVDGGKITVKWVDSRLSGNGEKSEVCDIGRVYPKLMKSAARVDGSLASTPPNKRARTTESPPLALTSFGWRPGTDQPHELAQHYTRGLQREECDGFRRSQVRRDLKLQGDGKGSHMSPQEKLVYTLECALLSGLPLATTAGGVAPSQRGINKAWGLSPGFHTTVLSTVYSNAGASRAERSDAGRNIIDDSAFAERRITPFSMFRSEVTNSGAAGATAGGIETMRAVYNAKSPEEKQQYEYLAQEKRMRAGFIKEDAISTLQRFRGKISWQRLADQIGNCCDASTLRRYFTNTEDFKYVSIGTMPLLTHAHIAQRILYAHDFWLWWNTAKFFSVPVLYVHWDEKWFYALVCRMHAKSILSLGVDPSDFKVGHRSHIGKVLMIAVVGCLYRDGCVSGGGEGFKIAFDLCGRIRTLLSDTRKRKYNADNTSYTMQGPISKKAGTKVVDTHEITGSSEGTPKKPKFSLLKYWRETVIPALEQIQREVKLASCAVIVVVIVDT